MFLLEAASSKELSNLLLLESQLKLIKTYVLKIVKNLKNNGPDYIRIYKTSGSKVYVLDSAHDEWPAHMLIPLPSQNAAEMSVKVLNRNEIH